MSERGLHRLFNRARLDDRLVNELIGLARGLLADGEVNEAEAKYLLAWLAANHEVSGNSPDLEITPKLPPEAQRGSRRNLPQLEL
ncbi:MAG: hypothetical protein Q8M31_21515 [Beijerinckiaceae bacterium]|nr:hypothetical protein [Beijerinckiaceae bacterium]